MRVVMRKGIWAYQQDTNHGWNLASDDLRNSSKNWLLFESLVHVSYKQYLVSPVSRQTTSSRGFQMLSTLGLYKNVNQRAGFSRKELFHLVNWNVCSKTKLNNLNTKEKGVYMCVFFFNFNWAVGAQCLEGWGRRILNLKPIWNTQWDHPPHLRKQSLQVCFLNKVKQKSESWLILGKC